MAVKHFLGGRILLGTEYAGYKVGIFEAGTSTPKTTYTDSSLTGGNENTHPVTLDANGAAQMWFSGNAKSILYTSADVVVYTDDNINLEAASSSATGASNLVINASFEEDTDADGIPDNWTRTLYTAGTFTYDSTNQYNGTDSVKFTSSGTGGGYITSTSNFAVSPSTVYTVGFAIKGTVDVRNVVEVLWYKYDGSASATASSTIYDNNTDNATIDGSAWTYNSYTVTSPSDAVFAKIRLTGCHSSDNTSGSTWFDDVKVTNSISNTGNESNSGIKTFTSGIGPQYIQNLGIASSVAANALTIALKGNDGNDPSASNIVSLAFRSTTATSGVTVVRQITSAASIVLPQGGTLGFTTSETGFIYIYLCDDGSSRGIGISKKALFDESALHTTTAVGTGSDSDIVLYTTNLLTGAAVRLIGRITIATGATPGDWSSEDTRIELWTPSMKKTGDIIQRIFNSTGARASTTNVLPFDDTTPQSTEGVEVINQAITATNALNKICIESQTFVSCETAVDIITGSIFEGTSCLTATAEHISAIGEVCIIRVYWEKAAIASSTTYSLRVGRSSGNTLWINGTSVERKFNGTANTYIKVWEEQA